MFTPNFADPIPEVSAVKDLGIYIDSDMTFKTHINTIISKTNNKCSWILRTFYNRELHTLRMLWKTLAQPHLDYGALLWYPTGNHSLMEGLEGPLRSFTRNIKGCKQMNYWQRLDFTGINSVERRIERFKIIYTWKVINGLAPSLDFVLKNDDRRGKTIVFNKPTGSVMRIVSLKEKSLQYQGPYLFNALPKCIREIEGDLTYFKTILDLFLTLLPDCPILKGYTTHTYDKYDRQSNSIFDWIKKKKLYDWELPLDSAVTSDAG